MNETMDTHGSLPLGYDDVPSSDVLFGSQEDFPPRSSSKGRPSSNVGKDTTVHKNGKPGSLPSSSKGGASSNDKGVDPSNHKGDKNAQAMHPRGPRTPYVILFNNCMAKADFKLQCIDSDSEMLDIVYDHIDSVDKTYGICFLGYVISGKPPTAALFDLVRRWGSNIQFQTHESGWIVFTFPSIEVRSHILSGGSYRVDSNDYCLNSRCSCAFEIAAILSRVETISTKSNHCVLFSLERISNPAVLVRIW